MSDEPLPNRRQQRVAADLIERLVYNSELHSFEGRVGWDGVRLRVSIDATGRRNRPLMPAAGQATSKDIVARPTYWRSQLAEAIKPLIEATNSSRNDRPLSDQLASPPAEPDLDALWSEAQLAVDVNRQGEVVFWFGECGAFDGRGDWVAMTKDGSPVLARIHRQA